MEKYVKKIKCKLCNGSKKSVRLGELIGDCIECDGLGVVFDIQTEEEIRAIEEQEKVKLAQEKRAKKEKIINDLAARLMSKNESISYEEAKKIAENEISKDLEFNDLIVENASNNEKSRKPRKKKEEVLSQPKEETVEDLIDSL